MQKTKMRKALAKVKAKVRSVNTILELIEENGIKETAKTVLKKEMPSIIAFYKTRKDEHERIKEKYVDPLRSLMLVWCKINDTKEIKTDENILKIGPRSSRSANAWKIYQALRKRKLSKNDMEKAFNKIFSCKIDLAIGMLGDSEVTPHVKENINEYSNVYVNDRE